MRVEVYWNLHVHLWSVRCIETGRVIDHSKYVQLEDVTWVVQPAGRARVLQQQRKNVYAFARGTLVEVPYSWTSFSLWSGARPIRYNPYRNSSFVYDDDESPIRRSSLAELSTSDALPMYEDGDRITPVVRVHGGAA